MQSAMFSQQPPPPAHPPPPVGAHPGNAHHSRPRRERRGLRMLGIAALVVVGLFVAFLTLGFVLLAFGDDPNNSTGLAVDGADVVDQFVAANGGSNWTVVTNNENPTENELVTIATALISLPEAEPLLDQGLDIFIYDEGGRQLRNITDNIHALDAAGAEGDVEKVIELAQDFPTAWVTEHSQGSVNARRSADGTPTYSYCPLPVGVAAICDDSQRIVLQPTS